MHTGLLRIVAATALLVCFAPGAIAADAGAYRTAPGWTNPTHRSAGRQLARPSGQRAAPTAWYSPTGRRGPGDNAYAHPKAAHEASAPWPSRSTQAIDAPGATVITRQNLDDMNATRFRDVLPYVPGVSVR
jgi:hypothetical protein